MKIEIILLFVLLLIFFILISLGTFKVYTDYFHPPKCIIEEYDTAAQIVKDRCNQLCKKDGGAESYNFDNNKCYCRR